MAAYSGEKFNQIGQRRAFTAAGIALHQGVAASNRAATDQHCFLEFRDTLRSDAEMIATALLRMRGASTAIGQRVNPMID